MERPRGPSAQPRQLQMEGHDLLIASSLDSIPSASQALAALNSTIDRPILSTSSVTIRDLTKSPTAIAVTSVAATLGSTTLYWRYFRRIRNAEHLTPATLKWRRTLVGRCTSVGDADGFRLYHQPPFPFRLLAPAPHSPKSDQTLSVRMAGADAPESGHFGKEAQPFAKEAKEEMKRLVEGKTVWCEVAHVDQYKRLVATPYVLRFPYIFGRTNVSLRMVKLGLATVYTQSGAAYANARWWQRLFRSASKEKKGKETSWGLRQLEKAEKKAKSAKRGMWSLGDRLESPADYKRRLKEQ
ncbi:mitochondrion protein [Ceraceosorus bombacis]|uniref:Mitochondrion protein n=1 Tax=Ceraceosorus bombacis TaxID=401625 RepID=A0A0P1BR83_9BASI|nr:mitochondrion protein [Ceraceosorus bombacis]